MNVINPRNTLPEHLQIRHAELSDIEALAAVELKCFPIQEAATPEEIRERVKIYGDHFWILSDHGEMVSFLDGMVTEEKDLRDEMYADASIHDPSGSWQMIFGVNTIPEKRRQGYAGLLIKAMIFQAYEEHRKGLVLTCKKEKIPFYSSFGFQNEGISASVHGNTIWYQMRLSF